MVARIGWEPRIVGDDVGTTPIFNWLLTAMAFPRLRSGSAHFPAQRGDDAPVRTVESAAILFTVLLAFMEIRHSINGGDVYRRTAGLAEVALQMSASRWP